MAQERYIAVYPPALKLPAGGNPATHALEQGMAAWSQQLQQWLSQEVSKILGQATDHGQQIDALENVGKSKARAYRNAAQNIDRPRRFHRHHRPYTEGVDIGTTASFPTLL